MGLRTFCAAAAMAMAVAAPAAAAPLVLVFDIEVTDVTGSNLPASFDEFSFDQTWTLNLDSAVTGPTSYFGPATSTASPVRPELLAFVSPLASFSGFQLTTNAPDETSVKLESNVFGTGAINYFLTLSDISFDGMVDPLNASTLLDFLLDMDPLIFTEGVIDQSSGTDQVVRLYSGSARLKLVNGKSVEDLGGAGVPEPSSWALLIVGFGAAGALLRRRALSQA